jgi:hypothetical protein
MLSLPEGKGIAMTGAQWFVTALVLLAIGVVVFGLATGRLDRRAEGCCPADPAKDLRMRGAGHDS